MNKVAIIQARMGSSRFPGKVLEKLANRDVLSWIVDAAQKIPTIDCVVVATSEETQDLPIVEWCQQNKINVFRGHESDVLDRFYSAAKHYNADIIVRLTADCPLLDPALVGQVLSIVSHHQADYASNTFLASWPDGLDCEAFTFDALEKAFQNATMLFQREHVTPYIIHNQHLFKVRNIDAPIKGLSEYRWTIDTPEDLQYIEKIILKSPKNPTTWDILETISTHPEIKQPDYVRNEGYTKSLIQEVIECKDFQTSQKLLKRSLQTIPLGSQTFSKSYIQYPQNTAPLFLTHGNGAKVWDVDGNEYVDLVSGLLPVVLGYNDLDINEAIKAQLSKGISFSLSTELEVQLAEKLCQIIPSAQKVRFAKNGTDATSAAVRISRAYTGRDHVMVCGYHGWQDWYIGTTTRNKGIPKAVSDLSVSVPYNDLSAVEELLKTELYACLIMEPCNTSVPQKDYFHNLKVMCEQYGTLLVFDEIITGFRFALGGAQEYFGVTPHITCLGKAMGNGMPISAIVGRDDIMHEMEEIFFSGTFGGECLSIAASLATICKIEKEKVIDHLWSYGSDLSETIGRIICERNLENVVKLVGYSPWKILQFSDQGPTTSFEVKTFFIQEMIRRGILINSSLNINFSHGAYERYKIIQAFEEVLELLSRFVDDGLHKHLQSPAIQPLFKVR